MDNLTKQQRSYNMSRIRSNNTQLELKCFQLLDTNKISYIKYPKVYGKPDCQIKNLLIFIDSDFWHGWKFEQWKDRLPKEYWVEKISGNIKRDNKKFRMLRIQGYKVLRIWGHSLKDADKIMKKIYTSLDER